VYPSQILLVENDKFVWFKIQMFKRRRGIVVFIIMLNSNNIFFGILCTLSEYINISQQ